MFETTDLGFAVTMVTLGYRIQEVKMKRNIMTFCFENNESFMNDMVTKYINDEISVPAKSYFNNIKTVKNVGKAE